MPPVGWKPWFQIQNRARARRPSACKPSFQNRCAAAVHSTPKNSTAAQPPKLTALSAAQPCPPSTNGKVNSQPNNSTQKVTKSAGRLRSTPRDTTEYTAQLGALNRMRKSPRYQSCRSARYPAPLLTTSTPSMASTMPPAPARPAFFQNSALKMAMNTGAVETIQAVVDAAAVNIPWRATTGAGEAHHPQGVLQPVPFSGRRNSRAPQRPPRISVPSASAPDQHPAADLAQPDLGNEATAPDDRRRQHLACTTAVARCSRMAGRRAFF